MLIPNHWTFRNKTVWINEEDDGNAEGRWQVQPSTTVFGDRYGLRTAVWWNIDDRAPERFELDLTRRMVDGRFAVTYVLQRDGAGELNDHSLGVEFVLRALPGI